MKHFWKYLVFLLLLPSALQADLLVLQNGKRISGFFLKEVGEKIYFKTMAGEELSVPKSQVKKMSLGYTGSPVCLNRKDAKKGSIQCNALLYKIKKGKVLVAEGEGFLKLKELPLEQVEEIKFQKADAKAARQSSALPSEVEVELQTKNGKIRGRVQKGDSKSWSIKDKNGKLHKINKNDIAAVVLYPEKSSIFDRDLRWWHIFPGLYQYRQGHKWKGAAIGGGFGLAMLGVFVEYQASLKAAREGSSDPTVLFFYNDSYKKSFEAHQAREKMYGLVAALIYAYHVVDYFYLGGYGKNSAGAVSQSGFFIESRGDTTPSFVHPEFTVSTRKPIKHIDFIPEKISNHFQRIELGFRYNF